jgi:hypothetical protein
VALVAQRRRPAADPVSAGGSLTVAWPWPAVV